MKLWQHYHTPTSVDEALSLLAHYQGQAQVIAGGTDLLIDVRAGNHPPYHALIDITCIPELGEIVHQDGIAIIGAGVTHSQIVKSSLLAEGVTALVEGCGVVGGPQVRNVGTLGGNVAHALPAGDGTVSLVALDAEAEIVLDGEHKRLPIQQMYRGPGQSLLDTSRDLLLRFHVPLCGPQEATAFKRIMRPQGVALPVLGCAVWIRLDETGDYYAAARVCIAPTGPIPRRLPEIEDALTGQPANNDTLERAVTLAQETVNLRTSKYRATADYRREMTAVLLRRSLPLAVQRARTGTAIPEGVGL